MASTQTIRLINADNEVLTVNSRIKYVSSFIMDALKTFGPEDYVAIPIKEVNGQALKIICNIYNIVDDSDIELASMVFDRFLSVTPEEYSDLLQAAEHLKMPSLAFTLATYRTCKRLRYVRF